MYKFNERLKELREERGLTQAQTAELFGLARNTIFSYETGRRVPDVEIVERMATEFDVTIDYLIGRSYNRTNEDDAIGSVTGLDDDAIKKLRLFQAVAKNRTIHMQSKNHSFDFRPEEVYDVEFSPEVYSMFLKMINILCSDEELLLNLCKYVFDLDNEYQTYLSHVVDVDELEEPMRSNIKTDSKKVSQAINMYRLQQELNRVHDEQLSHAKKD